MKKIYTSIFSIVFTSTLFAQLNVGLVAKYSFNSGNANDEVGSNNLTPQNGLTYGTDRFGNTNTSALLDGADDYLRTNSPFFSPDQPYSFSLWFKSDNASQSVQTLFNTDPHTQLSVGYNWYGDGTFDIGLSSGMGWDICSTAPNGLDTFTINGFNAENWNHFVINYDGSSWNYYINNTFIKNCNSGTPASTASDLFFGAISVGPQSYFAGMLDDIRIYNRSITTIEIDSLYNEPNPATLSTTETEKEKLFSVFPNPATNQLTILNSSEGKYEMTNILGEIVFTKKIYNTETIDINNLPAGVYFIREISLNKSIKFIKN